MRSALPASSAAAARSGRPAGHDGPHGANTYTGGTTISAGTLQLGDGGARGGIIGNVVNNSTLSFNRADAMIIDGEISGTGAVNQIGTGTTILTGDNTYTGPTTISAGTLQIGNGGTTGSLGSGPLVNNGTSAFSRSDTLTLAQRAQRIWRAETGRSGNADPAGGQHLRGRDDDHAAARCRSAPARPPASSGGCRDQPRYSGVQPQRSGDRRQRHHRQRRRCVRSVPARSS